MKVAIVGYGKMGKQIEHLLKQENIIPVAIIDKFSPLATHKEINRDSMKDVSIAIDFTSPEGFDENLNGYIKHGVSVVMGTTGWYDKLDEVKKKVGNSIGFIWSGNFSIGVNIFFKIVREASTIMNKFTQYDPFCFEIHHNEKIDSPSGTSMMIANIVKDELERKNRIVTDKLDRRIEPDEIHSASIRGGKVPGTHSVSFDSAVDTIELKHTVRSREGLAEGAVFAAKWLNGKKGFYSIDDLMGSII